MKKITIALIATVLFTACSKPEKRVPLIKNIFLLQQDGDDKGYVVAQEVGEKGFNKIVEEYAVDVYSNPLNVFVKTLSATKDTNFYSIRIKNEVQLPAVVVQLTRARFTEQVLAECADCKRATLKQDAATKAWAVDTAAVK
jgi:hypothetical protein